MKKLSKILSLALALVMLLSVSALAAAIKGTQLDDDTNTKAAIWSIQDVTGATATFDNSNEEIIHVTYAHPALEGEYLIMMITATEGKDNEGNANGEFTMADPGDQTIKYIDQVTAKDVGGTPTIAFDVYPSSISDSIIVIYGMMPDGSKSLQAAIIEAKYILGDVDKSGEVDVGDATMLLRYLADLEPASAVNLAAADTDYSGAVDVGDATKLLRVLAGLDPM